MKNTAQIIKSEIRVSANQLSADGMIASHEVIAILPGCRKAVKISEMPAANQIIMRPLHGYNGSASISPIAWADLVQASPIVSDDLFPVELTPAIREWARAQAMRLCTCPAVTNLSECHPKYLADLRHDTLEMSAILKAAR